MADQIGTVTGKINISGTWWLEIDGKRWKPNPEAAKFTQYQKVGNRVVYRVADGSLTFVRKAKDNGVEQPPAAAPAQEPAAAAQAPPPAEAPMEQAPEQGHACRCSSPPVAVSIGVTVNLENYENLRVEVSGQVAVEVLVQELDKVLALFGREHPATAALVDGYRARVLGVQAVGMPGASRSLKCRER